MEYLGPRYFENLSRNVPFLHIKAAQTYFLCMQQPVISQPFPSKIKYHHNEIFYLHVSIIDDKNKHRLKVQNWWLLSWSKYFALVCQCGCGLKKNLHDWCMQSELQIFFCSFLNAWTLSSLYLVHFFNINSALLLLHSINAEEMKKKNIFWRTVEELLKKYAQGDSIFYKEIIGIKFIHSKKYMYWIFHVIIHMYVDFAKKMSIIMLLFEQLIHKYIGWSKYHQNSHTRNSWELGYLTRMKACSHYSCTRKLHLLLSNYLIQHHKWNRSGLAFVKCHINWDGCFPIFNSYL